MRLISVDRANLAPPNTGVWPHQDISVGNVSRQMGKSTALHNHFSEQNDSKTQFVF